MNKLLNLIQRNSDVESFIDLNKSHRRNVAKIGSVALFELQVTYPAFIGYSYFARVLESLGVELIGYRPVNDLSKISRFVFKFLQKIPLDNGINWPFRIMRSFGVSKFILPSQASRNQLELEGLFLEFTSLNKLQKLNFKINDVVVGDLFYDWHLRQRGLPTITEEVAILHDDFFQFFGTFLWWEDYFANNKVNSIFVSHSVYSQGVLARIGFKNNSNVFLVGPDRVYRLSEKNLHPDMEFLDYTPGSKQQFGYSIDLVRAKNAIESLRGGSQELSAAHSYVTGYKGFQGDRIIEENGKINIMIAAHCFSDAPHANGDFHFADFAEWLKFLGKKSWETKEKYNWYIKAHPAFFESDKIHFAKITADFPWIQPISSTYSNLELFAQGVQVVLTIHGTIAFEAAYENVLVINASNHCPHIKYDFSLRPSSKVEYDAMIDSIPKLLTEFVIMPEDILHFYDMHHLRKNSNIYFGQKYEELLEFIGGYKEIFTNPKVFKFWLDNVYEKSLDENLLSEFVNFFQSNAYLMFQENNSDNAN